MELFQTDLELVRPDWSSFLLDLHFQIGALGRVSSRLPASGEHSLDPHSRIDLLFEADQQNKVLCSDDCACDQSYVQVPPSLPHNCVELHYHPCEARQYELNSS